MLTKLTIRNFKRFREVEIELGSPVVLIGPNNSGKTAALQALALWESGVKRWVEQYGTPERVPKRRPGITLNRRDLNAIPVPHANLLWRNRHTRDVSRATGTQSTSNVRIEIIVEGVTESTGWSCGLEFDYANPESIYCRSLRLSDEKTPERMPVPKEAAEVRVAFLPPMSGLAANETRLDPGAIRVRVGEGRTAEVLRNLCYQLTSSGERDDRWARLRADIAELFGVAIEAPEYVPERGEITQTYREPDGTRLDISCSGRGLQQTLLLLAYLYANPGAILLLDEPDAHLEVLRQRQIYNTITQVAREQGGQIVAASHSEIVLDEAAGRDTVIAFVGVPHRIDDRGSQLRKSLRTIGFEHYYQAEHCGWVLFLEGSTDLAILQAFARTLDHPAAQHLARPYVHYVGGNDPQRARDHYYGVREAVPAFLGIAIYDHLERTLQDTAHLRELMWERQEIENYLCFPDVLEAFARGAGEADPQAPLFAHSARVERARVMGECIRDLVPPVAMRDPGDRWWRVTKASDDFLDLLFAEYYRRLDLPNVMSKSSYHVLAGLVPAERIDPEIVRALDLIAQVAERATPAEPRT